MPEKQPIKVKVYARAIIAIALIVSWSLSAISGLILWLAPEGRRPGNNLYYSISPKNRGERYISGFASLS